jgi:hypothetical protein
MEGEPCKSKQDWLPGNSPGALEAWACRAASPKGSPHLCFLRTHKLKKKRVSKKKSLVSQENNYFEALCFLAYRGLKYLKLC